MHAPLARRHPSNRNCPHTRRPSGAFSPVSRMGYVLRRSRLLLSRGLRIRSALALLGVCRSRGGSNSRTSSFKFLSPAHGGSAPCREEHQIGGRGADGLLALARLLFFLANSSEPRDAPPTVAPPPPGVSTAHRLGRVSRGESGTQRGSPSRLWTPPRSALL